MPHLIERMFPNDQTARLTLQCARTELIFIQTTSTVKEKCLKYSFNTDLRKIPLLTCVWLTPLAFRTEQNKPNGKTFFYPSSCTRNSSLKEKQMAVLDGRRAKKQKQRPLSGSFSHQKIQDQDLRPDQGFLLCPRKSFSSTRSWSRKLVLMKRMRRLETKA